MKITQLQAYNALYKVLNYYYDKTKDEDMMSLVPGMVFVVGGETADPAIWEDWEIASGHKKMLTKQEAFDAMIRFFEEYHSVGPYHYTKSIINKLHAAKDCNDISIPLVKQWNFYLEKALSEPEETKEYLDFGDPMENIPPMVGFNAIYKLLDYYNKQKKSVDVTRMTSNMLFLLDGDTTVDSAAIDIWMELLGDKVISTREEVFEKTIQFLETYGSKLSASESKSIADKLRSAKNSEDFGVPLVELWDYCLVEALNEPTGTINYK